MVGSPEQAMFGSLLAAAAIRRPYMAGCADRIAFIGHERAVEAFLPRSGVCRLIRLCRRQVTRAAYAPEPLII